jgi:hypothetical protein
MSDFLWELERVPWSALRSGGPTGTAEVVPQLLRALAEADGVDSRNDIRVALEREIMNSSMLLFEVAPYVVPFLLAVLVHTPDIGRKATSFVLLEEIAQGEPYLSELDAGNDDLAAQVKRELCEGRAVYYSFLGSSHFPFRSMAVDLLAALDGSAPRFRYALDWLEEHFPDAQTAELVADARDQLADR